MAISLLVGTEKGLFVIDSDDRRLAWSVREPAHLGWQVYSLFGDGAPGTPTVYAGLSSAVYGAHLARSEDCGRTWAVMEGAPRFADGSPRRLHQVWSIQAGRQPGALMAGVSEAALFASSDAGATWAMNEGLEAHPTRAEWTPGAGGLCLHTLIPDARDPDRLFIGISAVGVFRSDDGGTSWALKNKGVGAVTEEEQRKYTEVMRCVHKVVQDPTDPDRLYQQNHVGVYRSVDAGDNWERIEEGLPSSFGFPILMHPHRPRTLFVVPQKSDQARIFPDGRPGVYRTDDGGDHWARTHVGLEEPSYSGVLRNAMAADAEDEPGVYFGTTGGEVYASLDCGERCARLPGRFPRVQSVAAITR